MRSAIGILACLVCFLSGCMSGSRGREPFDPDAAREQITRLIPARVQSRDGWAVDIYAAFEALGVPPDTEKVCSVIAVVEQESTFQVNPPVPGLPTIARREIESRAASHHIPPLMVSAALEVRSPNGKTYGERLAGAKTEKALSDLYEDFINSVPLGEQLFADLNPVRTGGPMQVSVAFAEGFAKKKRYPYPLTANIRHEVFTRRGGLYFGIAHLLDYPAPYDDPLYRFADYNAGHYSSRNAAFQSAVSAVCGKRLALDGDLLLHGSRAGDPSNTELAVRTLGARLELSDAQIRDDLEREDQPDFERTRLYSRLFALADQKRGRPVPRAVVPRIRLESPKITRKLTTDWFAHRVDERYHQCLSRSSSQRRD